MVKVNNLSKAAAPKTGTEAVPQTLFDSIREDQVDLTKSSGNKSTELVVPGELRLPAFLQKETPGFEAAGGGGGEWLGFREKTGKNVESLAAAGVEVGAAYLMKDNTIIPLNGGFDYFLLDGSVFLTTMDDSGKFTFVTEDIYNEEYRADRTKGLHYVAVLLVVTGESLVPIRGDFRSTKTSGIEGAKRAVEAAARPDWLGKSDAHRVTGAFPKPFGRVVSRMTTRPYINPKNGRKPYVASGQSRPTPPNLLQKLVDAFQDQDFTKSLTQTYDGYLRRVEYLRSLIAAPAAK